MKFLVAAYLLEEGAGSEFDLGIAALKLLQPIRPPLVTELSQLEKFNGRLRKIRKLVFKKVEIAGERYLIIGLGRKIEASSSWGYRFWFQLWLVQVWAIARRNKKRRVWLVSLAQAVSVNPFLVSRQKHILGPLGGRGRIYSYRWVGRYRRVINWLLVKGVYTIFGKINRVFGARVFVVHPQLADTLSVDWGVNAIIPAITTPSADQVACGRRGEPVAFSDRRNVVIAGRHISTKNPDIAGQVFARLANEYKHFNFIILGSGWNVSESSDNHVLRGRVPQPELFDIFHSARLHLFLSFELAGEVSLQASMCGCPTLCLDGFGADFLLNPSADFRVNPNVRSVNEMVESVSSKIRAVIGDNERLGWEAERQRLAAGRWNLSSRQARLLPQLLDLNAV